jgi:hypothetical protein
MLSGSSSSPRSAVAEAGRSWLPSPLSCWPSAGTTGRRWPRNGSRSAWATRPAAGCCRAGSSSRWTAPALGPSDCSGLEGCRSGERAADGGNVGRRHCHAQAGRDQAGTGSCSGHADVLSQLADDRYAKSVQGACPIHVVTGAGGNSRSVRLLLSPEAGDKAVDRRRHNARMPCLAGPAAPCLLNEHLGASGLTLAGAVIASALRCASRLISTPC